MCKFILAEKKDFKISRQLKRKPFGWNTLWNVGHYWSRNRRPIQNYWQNRGLSGRLWLQSITWRLRPCNPDYICLIMYNSPYMKMVRTHSLTCRDVMSLSPLSPYRKSPDFWNKGKHSQLIRNKCVWFERKEM